MGSGKKTKTVRVFALSAEARASALMLLNSFGLKAEFAGKERDAEIAFDGGKASVGRIMLNPATLNYASITNCFSRKPQRLFKLYASLAKYGIKPPVLLKKLRPVKQIPVHSDEAAALRIAFGSALSREKIARSKKPTPRIVFTHDVDSFDSMKRIQDVLEVEESFGVESCWFVVFKVREAFFGRFPELAEKSFSHGFNHEGTLLASEKRMREELAAGVWNEGFRAPWLHHSPEMFEVLSGLGVKFDSSLPNFENVTPFFPPGGCGEIIPFQLLGEDFKPLGITEYPVTMVQDYAFYVRYNSSSREILEYWQKRSDSLIERGGLVNLITHPDEKDTGSQAGLRNYERILEHLSKNKKYWAGFAAPGL